MNAQRNTGAWLFAGFLGFYLLFAGGHLYTGDARTVQATARSVLSGDGFAIPFDRSFGGTRGPDGRFYGQYGLGAVLTALPAVWLGDRLGTAFPAGPLQTQLVSDLPLSVVNAPFAAGAVALVRVALLELGFHPAVALATAAAAGLTTPLWPYAGRDFSEPQLAFLLLLALAEALKLRRTGESRHAAVCGAALGYALLTKVYAVVLVPLYLILAWEPVRRRPGLLASAAAPVAAATLALAWYNFHRFGSALATGYSAGVQGSHIPLAVGLFGLLFSAGKSFFLFNPPLVLGLVSAGALHRRNPAVSWFLWTMAGVHLAFFGCLQNWDGDWSWGPRYLLPLAPLLMLAAAPFFQTVLERGASAPRKAACWTILGLGLLVQFLGTAVNPNDYVKYLGAAKGQLGDYLPAYGSKLYVPFHQHHWNPDLSPLRGHWFLLKSTFEGAPGRLTLYSTAEEWNDEQGHRMLPYVELGIAEGHAGSLDFWFASMPRLLAPAQKGAALLPLALVALGLLVLAIPRLARAHRLAVKDMDGIRAAPGEVAAQ